MKKPDIHTLGALKESGYQVKSIKSELRDNLITSLKEKRNIFPELHGYEDTVIPDIERAILSRHNLLLLGLRGQAKTKVARLMTRLLDEYIPAIEGNDLNDDPLHPISLQGKKIVREMGNDCPIRWIHRSERYIEKLATPDVSIADLIGDIDPIKAASLKLPYSDERVIHFGLVPRAHRSLFVINELPDLQARIQVSLFNILQEGDLQIRGFALRLPLDIHFIFTANPEDYTNRGSIITPLKDRIESQILTHYPKDVQIAQQITRQEARITKTQEDQIYLPEVMREFIELITHYARHSEYVDQNSGVSARVSIAALENLYATAERRMIRNQESQTSIRLSDFWGVIPALTGKIELMYEGEEYGAYEVALDIINEAMQDIFDRHFPDPDKSLQQDDHPYHQIKAYFESGQKVNLIQDSSDEIYHKTLDQVLGVNELIKMTDMIEKDEYIAKEITLFGLSVHNVIERQLLDQSVMYLDPLSGLFDNKGGDLSDLLDE